jgi:predicted RNase H-like HicB family nuclease
MADMKTITARFTREAPDWVVELVEEPRVHSFGRTLEKAQRMILDAAALWYDVDVRELHLVPIYEVGAPTSNIEWTLDARRAAAKAELIANAATQRTVGELIDSGLSLRDVATMFGLSHQRVHQLATGNGADGPGQVRMLGSITG